MSKKKLGGIAPENAKIFRENVEGAPFKIGDKVTVLDDPEKDETFDDSFIGYPGTIVDLDYQTGVGQTYPGDPMIGVDTVVGYYCFWKEELKLRED